MAATNNLSRRVPASGVPRKHATGPSRRNVQSGPGRGPRSCRSAGQRLVCAPACTVRATAARYYDPQTAQFLTRDPLEARTRSAYGYVDGDPLDGGDPTGLDHCIPFTNICIGFHPGTIPNSIVNIGRGMSFGLSDKIANWISPGASCTVPQNSGQQLVGNAATIVATLGWGSAADAARAAPDLENLSPKILRQMESRGWTQDQIQEAYDSGERVNATNKANGNPASRYINPTTGQSVVVDNVTGEVIHVGGPGFLYGPGSGDLP